VPPAHPTTTKTAATAKKHPAARPAPKVPAHKAARAHASPFTLPHVAVPALATIAAPARTPRSLDVLLAGVVLLLAAVTAGSGARLVSLYNRRAGAA
jgi:hypothetical protein